MVTPGTGAPPGNRTKPEIENRGRGVLLGGASVCVGGAVGEEVGLGSTVMLGVGVSSNVMVGVGVLLGSAVKVDGGSVSVAVREAVGVGVPLAVGRLVGVGVPLAVGRLVGVGVPLAVGRLVGVGVPLAVGRLVWVGLKLGKTVDVAFERGDAVLVATVGLMAPGPGEGVNVPLGVALGLAEAVPPGVAVNRIVALGWCVAEAEGTAV